MLFIVIEMGFDQLIEVCCVIVCDMNDQGWVVQMMLIVKYLVLYVQCVVMLYVCVDWCIDVCGIIGGIVVYLLLCIVC